MSKSDVHIFATKTSPAALDGSARMPPRERPDSKSTPLFVGWGNRRNEFDPQWLVFWAVLAHLDEIHRWSGEPSSISHERLWKIKISWISAGTSLLFQPGLDAWHSGFGYDKHTYIQIHQKWRTFFLEMAPEFQLVTFKHQATWQQTWWLMWDPCDWSTPNWKNPTFMAFGFKIFKFLQLFTAEWRCGNLMVSVLVA